MEFTFVITSCDKEKLLPQVSRALETRTQMLSRQKYPGMWKATDALHAHSKSSGAGNGRRKFLSILCLALGIFLFVPGLVKPQELQGPLVMGAIAVGAGIGGLWRSRKKKSNPFDRSAALLLADKETVAGSAQVVFSQEGMQISDDEEVVPYSDFEFFIEGRDVYLITFTGRVVLLQTKPPP